MKEPINLVILNENKALSGIKEQIEERLKKQQKSREYKDIGTRTGYSRKERAAYAAILKGTDIDSIEKDEATAIEIVKKQRVWLKVDLQAERDGGTSPGCAYLKQLLQQSYMAKPLANTPDQRKIYILVAEGISANLDNLKTITELTDTPSVLALYNAFIGPISGDESRNYISFRDFEIYWTKAFYNVYTMIHGYRGSEAVLNHYKLAVKYDGLSKEEAEKNYTEYKNRLEERNKRYQDALDRSMLIMSVEDMKLYSEKYSIIKSNMLPSYLRQKDWKQYKEYTENVIVRWINQNNDLLKPDKIPWNCTEHEPDWSWAFGIEKKKRSEKKDGITINTGIPLSFIKRTGGMQIIDVSEQDIISKLGFVGVTLGNYMKDIEAKEHIRHFVCAITDLCEILNFDPHIINQPLSIGFGAYGRGGKAMATYYPTLHAINLTKRRGDGCVSHEWGHYLDNYLFNFNNNGFFLSEWASHEYIGHFGYMAKYLKKNVRGSLYSESIAKYINQAAAQWKNNPIRLNMLYLMGYIRFGIHVKYGGDYIDNSIEHKNSSNYYDYCSKMSGNYWASPVEMFARGFECYVYDKLDKAGRANNYLVSGGYFSDNVYPQGDDRTELFVLYDNLIQAIVEEDKIPEFMPWTDIRNDEYIVFDEKSDNEEVTTGVIVQTPVKPTNDNRIRIAKAKLELKKKKLKLLEL